MSRGATWTRALASAPPSSPAPSVLRADTDLSAGHATLLTVIADPQSRYTRARDGELGVREALVLAEQVVEISRASVNLGRDDKPAIIAVVDLPSQAYGRLEETLGLHELIACTVDAYAAARSAGHPIVGLIVGSALSGGFLAHGLQANQLVALNDPGVHVHAMRKPAAARVTRRTVAELERLAVTVTPLSYAIEDWARLGSCDALVDVADADQPTTADLERVRGALSAAVNRARQGPLDLSNRRTSAAAIRSRGSSRRVYELMAEQW